MLRHTAEVDCASKNTSDSITKIFALRGVERRAHFLA